jgi:hypothetical protein
MKTLLVTTAAVGSLLLAPPVHAATWTTVASTTSDGTVIGSMDETVAAPTALRLRARSQSEVAVAWVVTCTSGDTVLAKAGSWFPDLGRDRRRLPVTVATPDSCRVMATVNAEGPGEVRVSLQRQ